MSKRRSPLLSRRNRPEFSTKPINAASYPEAVFFAARRRCKYARQCPSGGRAGNQYRQSIGRSALPLTRRTISAVSAANECEGITCLWQVTRNDSDEAERSERSPSGVVSAANVEELAAAGGQVSGEAAPASGSAPQPDRPLPPARGAGGRARRPPEPSAGRQSRAHYPPGSLPVLAFKSCYPPGNPAYSCGNDEPTIKLMCDWKAEMNLRTPRLPIGITDIGPTDFHGLARKARKLQSCRSAFPGSLLQW